MTFNMENEAYSGADIATLMEMLRYKRPHGSKSEKNFINRFIVPLGVEMDKFGNLIKRIGDSNVLWSCHTDTVHKTGGKQKVSLRGDIVTLNPKSKSNCLGADDAAGVWLMREMILADKPGLYIFHRGEECGGLGSNYISTYTPDLLSGIDVAIALDRMGRTSVITHQGFGRCCSDTFAESLCGALTLPYVLDDTGVFTDTANYTDLIAECTNLSVGYYSEHSHKESLDVAFLGELSHALKYLHYADLVVERNAGDIDESDYIPFNGPWDYDDSIPMRGMDKPKVYDMTTDNTDYISDLARLIETNPAIAASLLIDCGVTIDDFYDEVFRLTGRHACPF